MPVALGRRYVAAPPFAPSRYGLLSVADMPIDSDTHWRAGVEYQPNDCGPAISTLDDCPSGVSPTKSPTVTGIGTIAAEPFTVYAWIDCSATGFAEESELRTIAALTNGEGRAVEDTFWTGTTIGGAVRPHLAEDTAVTEGTTPVISLQTAASVVVTGAVDVVEAFGALEGELASCYGGEGVLHVPAMAVAHLSAQSLLVKDGQMLRTWMGNRVAVYASNNRQGPTGANPAAGQAWFYATGNVQARRSDISLTPRNESVDRASNSMVMVGERTYVIGWDCCHLAVQVSLGGVVTGTASAAT